MWKKFNMTKLFRIVEEPATVRSLKENARCAHTKSKVAISEDFENAVHRRTSKQIFHYHRLKYQHSTHHHPNYYHATMAKRNFSKTPSNLGWGSQMDADNKRRKVIPKLIYLHNPWKYIVTKYNLLKLRLLWDREFAEDDFIRGSKQAAVVLTDIIRTQNTAKVSQYTTPLGYQQITRDMLLSRNDSRLKLIKFDTEHLRRAIPIQVATRTNFGQKYCFIDMLFVGLRNTQDYSTPEEISEVKEVLRQLDADMKTPSEVTSVPHRIVFVEILIRFRRNYTNLPNEQALENENPDWAISFYKILTFDVLNYDPRS